MDNLEFNIEETENKEVMLLTIGGKKYYIGKYLSIIFELFTNGVSIDNIVKTLNSFTKTNTFNQKFVEAIIEDKIEPIIQNQNKIVKSSVIKIFSIIEPTKFDIIFQKLTFLFKAPIFYTILSITCLTNLFFYFFYVKPEATADKLQLPIIAISIILIVLVHEIGHSIASFYYKITPKEIGFGLYFIFPALYTDLTETWKLKKESRIVINIAGIYFQLIINFFLIAFLYTNLFNNYILYTIILSSQLICLFNLNPFFKFDGYWIYSDYFNIPNLRKQTLDLYAKFIENPSFKKVRMSLLIYAFLNLLFMSYVIYRIIAFIFSQHMLIYNYVINRDISNISIINWLMFALSFILIYILISKCVRIYKTYFNEK